MDRKIDDYSMGEARADLMRNYNAGTEEIAQNPSALAILVC